MFAVKMSKSQIVNVADVFGFLPDYLNHCSATTFSCSDPISPCTSSKRFDFPSLWTITLNYWNVCKSEGAWFSSARPTTSNTSIALSNVVCKTLAGGWPTLYPAADVWTRLTTWKFPLIQLLAVSPRPPLGWKVELFVVAHLLGDPIGSLADVLWRIQTCQDRAVYWQTHIPRRLLYLPGTAAEAEHDRLWKAFAIITDSYDEWGSEMGEKAVKALSKGLELWVSSSF